MNLKLEMYDNPEDLKAFYPVCFITNENKEVVAEFYNIEYAKKYLELSTNTYTVNELLEIISDLEESIELYKAAARDEDK